MSTAFGIARSRAISVFLAKEGYREGPRSNENFAGARYGWNFVAWCVQACWWSADTTGSSGGVPKTASTGAARTWFRAIGRYYSIPQPGDWSIMLDAKGNTMHTDLVVSYNPAKKELICVGGNTSGSFGGSVNNGNGVYVNNRWSRWKSGRIHGFGRPLYGVTTEDVQLVQRAAGIKVDGKYGPATKNATKALQRARGLTADGFPGPATIKALGGSTTAPAAPTGGGSSAGLADVDKSQGWLAKLGYDVGPIDGKFGSKTETATRVFQIYMGITPADGRPGPATRKELEIVANKIDTIIQKLDQLPRQVWGIGGGANAPMIGRRLEKGSEYPETTLGSLTDRIVRQQLVPLRGEVAGLVKAIEQLAGGQGIDPEEIRKAVAQGVDDALGNLEVTVAKGD